MGLGSHIHRKQGAVYLTVYQASGGAGHRDGSIPSFSTATFLEWSFIQPSSPSPDRPSGDKVCISHSVAGIL